VVLRGWQVPFLTATPLPGGKIHLTLDHRFGLDLSLADAEQVIPFLADCMAVALGYTGHPEADWETAKPRSEIVRMHGL
jgi:hypothetical protein